MDRGTHANRNLRFAIGFGLAVVLGACAGDTPESVADAFGEAAPSLGYVEEPEGPCVGQAVVDNVGFEELTNLGLSSDSIRQSPSDALSQVFEAHDSRELRDGVMGCVDVDGLVRKQLVVLNGGSDLRCAAPFTPETNFVTAHLDGLFETADADLRIEDTESNRDDLRACLEEDGFAAVFGIDRRADLEQAIEATLDESIRNVEEPCVGPAIVNSFLSPEGANLAGLTVEEPEFDISEFDQPHNRRVTLTDAVLDCGAIAENLAEVERTAEPYFGECIVEDFEDNFLWRGAAAREAIGGPDSETMLYRSRSLDACVADRVAEIFPDLAPGDRQVGAEVGSSLYEEAVFFDPGVAEYGRTEAELRCAGVEVVRSVDLVRLNELTFTEDPENPSLEQLQLWDEYFLSLESGYRTCIEDDLHWAAPYVERAGFSEETVDCVRSSVEIENFDLTLGSRTPAEVEAYIRGGERLLLIIEDALASCYTAEEQSIFDDVNEWLNGFSIDPSLLGEPESLST